MVREALIWVNMAANIARLRVGLEAETFSMMTMLKVFS
jgi:hypothetical protein